MNPEEKEQWKRIIRQRGVDCASFSNEFVRDLIALGEGNVHATNPIHEVMRVLGRHIAIMTGEREKHLNKQNAPATVATSSPILSSASVRRHSFNIVRELLEKIENEKQAQKAKAIVLIDVDADDMDVSSSTQQQSALTTNAPVAAATVPTGSKDDKTKETTALQTDQRHSTMETDSKTHSLPLDKNNNNYNSIVQSAMSNSTKTQTERRNATSSWDAQSDDDRKPAALPSIRDSVRNVPQRVTSVSGTDSTIVPLSKTSFGNQTREISAPARLSSGTNNAPPNPGKVPDTSRSHKPNTVSQVTEAVGTEKASKTNTESATSMNGPSQQNQSFTEKQQQSQNNGTRDISNQSMYLTSTSIDDLRRQDLSAAQTVQIDAMEHSAEKNTEATTSHISVASGPYSKSVSREPRPHDISESYSNRQLSEQDIMLLSKPHLFRRWNMEGYWTCTVCADFNIDNVQEHCRRPHHIQNLGLGKIQTPTCVTMEDFSHTAKDITSREAATATVPNLSQCVATVSATCVGSKSTASNDMIGKQAGSTADQSLSENLRDTTPSLQHQNVSTIAVNSKRIPQSQKLPATSTAAEMNHREQATPSNVDIVTAPAIPNNLSDDRACNKSNSTQVQKRQPSSGSDYLQNKDPQIQNSNSTASNPSNQSTDCPSETFLPIDSNNNTQLEPREISERVHQGQIAAENAVREQSEHLPGELGQAGIIQKSLSFLVPQTRKNGSVMDGLFRCSLCNSLNIRSERLILHCRKAKHKSLLRTHLETQGTGATNGKGNAANTVHDELSEVSTLKARPTTSSATSEISNHKQTIPSNKHAVAVPTNSSNLSVDQVFNKSNTTPVQQSRESGKMQNSSFAVSNPVREPTEDQGETFLQTEVESYIDTQLELSQRVHQSKVAGEKPVSEQVEHSNASEQSALRQKSLRFLAPQTKQNGAMTNGMFRCSLCNCENIHKEHLMSHCRNSRHQSLLRAHFEKQAAGDANGNGDDATDKTIKRSRNHTAASVKKKVIFNALEDKPPTFACTLVGRALTQVCFNHVQVASDLEETIIYRLKRWDPFWKTLSLIAMGVTSTVQEVVPPTNLINTGAVFNVTFNPEHRFTLPMQRWGQRRSSKVWTKGDKALLLRMMPLDTPSSKRADCHLWPKGTFLQVNGNGFRILQRKQQAHDPKLWKGMSQEFDALEAISDPYRTALFEIACADDQPFVYVLSINEYRSADQIFDLLMRPSSSEAIERLTREEGYVKAREFASRQMTLTVGDQLDDHNNSDIGRFVFSLKCPLSKRIMETPVRGKSCKHWQCYDLESYINSNVHISGSRWRCAACENFVSLQDLEYCGLTAYIIKEFEKVLTEERDRIEFSEDGRYKLLEARPLRYGKKRPKEENNGSSHGAKKVCKANEDDIIEIS